jgi:glycosyltransferase involved in cell wall biosynthesis
MPLVSIIMPTYNRADTIRRALQSIQAQTIQDWELIVVDDGSTDETISVITGLDPRMTIVRQDNQGNAVARNVGLRHSAGSYIAFLDSDDEWLPYHLELCIAFLRAHPEEAFVTTIFSEDFGQGRIVNHPQVEIWERYPTLAKRINSCMLDLPPGETDNYLRVFSSREPIGEWGNHIVAQTPYQNVHHYSGDIFEYCRWGFVMGLPPTVMTREAFETAGFSDASYYIASDFGYTVNLCRHFRANFLSIPTYIKHELTREGKLLKEDHIAKGRTMPIFAKDMLRWHEELFWKDRQQDRELSMLRSIKQLYVAKTNLIHGMRDEALLDLNAALHHFPGLWEARVLKGFIQLVPRSELCMQTYVLWEKAVYSWGQLLRGEMSAYTLVRKLISL